MTHKRKDFSHTQKHYFSDIANVALLKKPPETWLQFVVFFIIFVVVAVLIIYAVYRVAI